MTRTISARDLAIIPRTLAGRVLSGAVVAAWLAIFLPPAAKAAEPARDATNSADRLNHPQMAAVIPANATPATALAGELGILFLRADGGDPQELRADSGAALVFVARRDGNGRAYRNGREVGLDPGVKESAAQIAATQFGAARNGDIVLSSLPAPAQAALSQYAASGAAPRILFVHVTSRLDTGRVSDQRAKKILALEASANAGRDMLALVKMAMQMFGLKSDACDNSEDPRCNEPGVGEAFAQIKREEVQQRAATAARF